MPASDNKDIRDAFFDGLFEVAKRRPDVILLTDDQGAFSLTKFKENLPGQYLNVGIAEQNLISVAAGLAMGGKIPFVYGISTFMALRCYEQIKLDLCCMNLPVTIVGSGPGFTYGSDGPTHHATQDVAVMRALPEISIYNLTDVGITTGFVAAAAQLPGPKYVRMEKGILPRLYPDDFDFSNGFEVIREGEGLAIISTGWMTHRALEAAQKLSQQGTQAKVIDLYRIKPVSETLLLKALEGVQQIVSIEEHSVAGGMGSLLGEILSDARCSVPLYRMGLPDEHCYAYGDREWLLSRNGLDVESICKAISDRMNK